MKIIAEISLYPLTDQYGEAVIGFIKLLKKHPEVEVRSNSMSTQVVGPLSHVMKAIESAYASTFAHAHRSLLVMKIFNEELEMEWQKI